MTFDDTSDYSPAFAPSADDLAWWANETADRGVMMSPITDADREEMHYWGIDGTYPL